MKKPEIGFEMDENSDLVLVLVCYNCHKKHRKKFREIKPGHSISCSCGAPYTFEGDDIGEAQRAWDDLLRTLKNFGK